MSFFRIKSDIKAYNHGVERLIKVHISEELSDMNYSRVNKVIATFFDRLTFLVRNYQ